MTSSLRQQLARGFTLIELLIVVIIIAILAAIAIPQFANSSGDAQEAALDANLNTLRSAIELYRVQHANTYPSAVAATGGPAACTAATGVLGTGIINSPEAFEQQLTQFSNAQGQTCSVAAPGFLFGPYLRDIPTDTVSATPSAVVAIVANAVAPNPAADVGGWLFESRSGRLRANSNRLDRNQRAFFER